MRRHHALLAVAALAATPLLAACGDDEGSKGGATGDFCTMARAFNAANDESTDIFFGEPSKDEVKKVFEDLEKQIGAMVNAAPSEIKADAQVVQAGLKGMVDAMKSIDYDMTKLFTDPTLAEKLEVLDTPEFEKASNNVDNYLQNTCGIDTES